MSVAARAEAHVCRNENTAEVAARVPFVVRLGGGGEEEGGDGVRVVMLVVMLFRMQEAMFSMPGARRW